MRYLNEIQQHLESLQKREGSLALAIRGLDALLAEHRASLDPQLQHYLSQRSYDKALAWVNALLGSEADAGTDSADAGEDGAIGTADAAAGGAEATPKAATGRKIGATLHTPPPGGCSGRRTRD